MKPTRTVTAAAAIGATTATIVTALVFGQTLPAIPEPIPAAAVSSTEDSTNPPVVPVLPAPEGPNTPGEPSPPEPPTEPEPTPDPDPVPTIEQVGGSVRWVSKASWGFVDNASHTPYGVSRVEVRADRVRIHFPFAASQVRDFSATVDEAFASSGVRVGASVNLSYADVFFYMGTSTKAVDPRKLSKANANVWFSGSFIVPPPAG